MNTTLGPASFSLWLGRLLLTIPRIAGSLSLRHTSLALYDAQCENVLWSWA